MSRIEQDRCENCGDLWGDITRASGQPLCGECYGVWAGENPATIEGGTL